MSDNPRCPKCDHRMSWCICPQGETQDARRAALRERLLEQIDEWSLWRDDPSTAFERMADEFYRETGFLAPGKSEPAEMYSAQRDAERRQRYEEWCRTRQDVRWAMLEEVAAAISAPSTSEVREEMWQVFGALCDAENARLTQWANEEYENPYEAHAYRTAAHAIRQLKDEAQRQIRAQRDALAARVRELEARDIPAAPPATRRQCVCVVPDPVMQADGEFYCYTCSFQTSARPNSWEPAAPPAGEEQA